MDDFVDAYSIVTGQKQRVPRIWLDDPDAHATVGHAFRKTPSQRELDGELGPRPNADNTVKEIDAWAEVAEVDLAGVKGKDEKLVAIEDALGPAPVQTGVVEAEVVDPPADPLAPELVAHVDAPVSPTTSTDGTASSEETPAAGDEEN
jgi:hypothetical protein